MATRMIQPGTIETPKLARSGSSQYLLISRHIKKYCGIKPKQKYSLKFIPDTNSRGQRFIGVWLVPK